MKLKNFYTTLLLTTSVFTAPSTAEDLTVGTIFSSNQMGSQSFLRFYNSDETSGNVTVTLKNSQTGAVLGSWLSPTIPAGSESQYRITTPETEADAAFTIPDYYNIIVDPSFNGAFQHVLWKPSDGTLTNLSSCGGNVGTNLGTVIAFHTTVLDEGYPATLAVTNTGVTATTVDLTIYDARDGTELGTYTTASIPVDGQVLLTAADIEAEIGVTASGTMFHFNIVVENGFNGYLQQLVDNQQAGVVTDMTALCTLTGTTGTKTSTFEGVLSGANDEGGAITVTIDTDVSTPASSSSSSQSASASVRESSSQVERPQAIVSASGTYTPSTGGTVSLSGTYDTATRSASLSGSDYSFTGSVDTTGGSQRLSGTYTGPSSSGGYSAARSTPSSRVEYKFCGNWSGTVDGGFVEGTWNFTIFNNGKLVGRTANKTDGDNQNMTGSERGRRVSGTTSDGTTFSGTINGSGSTFSGSFNSEGDVGDLSGRRCD
jgi:hypothetical protein